MEILRTPEAVAPYLTDTSGLHDAHCEAVYRPGRIEEIPEVLAEARRRGVGVTVSGAHTATTGAALPYGGLLLSTERLDRIGPVTVEGESARIPVEAGVRLATVQGAAAAAGWLYPPDPGESKATLGGNLSTHAAGKHGFHYGPSRRWVAGLTVFLADGDRLELTRGACVADGDARLHLTAESGRQIEVPLPTTPPPPVKHAAGYLGGMGCDAVDLFVGAEGTLGVIAAATLRLAPAPEETLAGLLFFPDEVRCWEAVVAIRDRIRAASGPIDERWGTTILEYLDPRAVDLLRPELGPLPTGAAALMVEQPARGGGVAARLSEWQRLCAELGGVEGRHIWAHTAEEKERLATLRYRIPTEMNATIARTGLRKVSCDMAVPDARLLDYLRGARELLGGGGVRAVGFGHIGDNHIHYNLLPEDEGELTRARAIYDELVDLALALGGTVSAEHGIGKLKRPYLARMVGEAGIAAMRRTREALDPEGILCPGNLFAT